MNKTSKMQLSRGRTPDGQPNPIDVYVGSRIRLRRELFGLSQMRLADKLGLTFQQIQKYERGTNRISASRLWDVAQVLDTPITYFFAEMDEQTAKQSPRRFVKPTDEKDKIPEPANALAQKEIIRLITAYQKIDNPKLADLILEITKIFSHCYIPV